MTLDRRQLMLAGLGVGAAAGTAAGPRDASARAVRAAAGIPGARVFEPADGDRTAALQSAIDDAAAAGAPLFLAPGRYAIGRIVLPSGTVLAGAPGQSRLDYQGGGACLTAERAHNVRLSGLVVDGADRPLDSGGLLAARDVQRLTVEDCAFTGSAENGMSLQACSGKVQDCEISGAAAAGLFCNDAAGVEIAHNHVHDCANNGIQVWRSSAGEDGTLVTNNRIESIRTAAGGSGQNGNGINVFRAGAVTVLANRISDCAFSAIRGNAASDCQMVANSCSRLGEVAIYAEFGFEGSIIANNLVNGAATGISVTNFNEGGRLAVVQGNLVRNLVRRDGAHGLGIGVEADAIVSANVIEQAAGLGIQVGWGKFLRDVTATGNVIRSARIGIGISAVPQAGYAFVTNNMITGFADSAIRAMDHAKPLGKDLAHASSEAFRNMAVFGNVAFRAEQR